MNAIFSQPHTGSGFMAYVMLGFGGALAALIVGSFFPAIIPTSAKNVRI